jgi:hypothetical protein
LANASLILEEKEETFLALLQIGFHRKLSFAAIGLFQLQSQAFVALMLQQRSTSTYGKENNERLIPEAWNRSPGMRGCEL